MLIMEFFQSATLDGGKLVKTEKHNSDNIDETINGGTKTQKMLTDEELFAACGGVTAHK